MSSFTGVSIVQGHEGCSCNTWAVDAGTNNGYHLLMVNGYSRTKEDTPVAVCISSGAFVVGGHAWFLEYFPNGENPNWADFICLYVSLFRQDDKPVDARFSFSFIDQVEEQMPMYIRATNQACRFADDDSDSWGTRKFLRKDALERSAHLKGDSFTIRCDIMVCKDPNTEDASGHDTKVLLSDIDQHFHTLLQTKVGADVTFEVSGAHIVVCLQPGPKFIYTDSFPEIEKDDMEEEEVSQVLEGGQKEETIELTPMLSDSFTEIEKDDMEEEEVSQVLEGGQKEEATEDEMWIQWIQDLFVAADRYDLRRLKCISERQLSDSIGVSSVMSTLALAEQHHCHGLKEACLKFIQVQSPSCLQTVTTTDGWDHVVSTYPSVLKELFVKLASNRQK
ncbi:hypothetical protein VPH35_107476 [Triticum aestivum]